MASVFLARMPSAGTISCCADESGQSKTKSSSRKQKVNVAVESTDFISSSLTRRFGLGAGLAWVGFLSFGVISEQIKTRLEVASELQSTRDVEQQQEVVLPDGVRLVDLTLGGGASPRPGDLVALDLVGKVASSGEVFVDTSKRRRPLVFVFGSKPYAGGVCEGLTEALTDMKSGGKRRVSVPPELGFGDQGAEFPDGKVPPNSELQFIVELQKVSISPS